VAAAEARRQVDHLREVVVLKARDQDREHAPEGD
jgi:hypothetical protein